jgi:hypothetical protein
MTEKEVAVFVEERKWDYRSGCCCSSSSPDLKSIMSAFGFTAALLEGLPIVGLVFTISNRVGAAMWAHGLSSHLFPAL